MRLNSILKKLVILLMLVLVCLGLQRSPAFADTKTEQQDLLMNTQETEIFNMINEVRRQTGAKALVFKPKLKKDANVRAAEADNFWSHTRPDGTAWWQLDPSNMYSECLEQSFGDTNEEIVKAWVSSPTHYEQLTRQDLTAGAISVYVNPLGIAYIAFEGGYIH